MKEQNDFAELAHAIMTHKLPPMNDQTKRNISEIAYKHSCEFVASGTGCATPFFEAALTEALEPVERELEGWRQKCVQLRCKNDSLEGIAFDQANQGMNLQQAQADCAAKDDVLRQVKHIFESLANIYEYAGYRKHIEICEAALQPNSGAAILERLKKAEEDSKRLDWLEAMYHRPEFLMSLSQDARQAIDSAIAAQSKGGE